MDNLWIPTSGLPTPEFSSAKQPEEITCPEGTFIQR